MTQQNGPDLLTGSGFARAMIGVPWANRACSWQSCDCWGLVVLYYRHVVCVEIHHSPGYEAASDFRTCFSEEVVFWQPVPAPQEGGIFIGYDGNQQAHVGLIIDGRALHSRGENGAVRSDRLSAVEKVFTKLEYMIYAGN